MAHNQRRYAPAGTAIHAVYIAAANSTGFDLDQHIIRSELRFGNILQGQLIVLFEYQGFHIFYLYPFDSLAC